MHAGLVENQRVGNARHLQQLAPVVVVAGQPRDLEAEHDADLPGGDARHQVAEAATVGGRGARLALVVVDHADATLAPAQRNRAAPQSVLAVRALGVRFDLLERRLAHVQAGLAGQMVGLDLVCRGFKHGGVLLAGRRHSTAADLAGRLGQHDSGSLRGGRPRRGRRGGGPERSGQGKGPGHAVEAQRRVRLAVGPGQPLCAPALVAVPVAGSARHGAGSRAFFPRRASAFSSPRGCSLTPKPLLDHRHQLRRAGAAMPDPVARRRTAGCRA